MTNPPGDSGNEREPVIRLDDYVKAKRLLTEITIGEMSVGEYSQELSNATPDDIQAIASAQIKILDSYHREVLTQAKDSFRWALVTTIAGFLFFICAVGFTLAKTDKSKALIPLISGAVIEVIAGVNFYLYGQATQQLSSFHRKLDRTQRFLLANSMCEAIQGEEREKTRSELVRTVSQFINDPDKE